MPAQQLGSVAGSRDEYSAIGLDVGGTKIAGGVVTLPQGQILARSVIPTLPKRGGQAVLFAALNLAARLIAEAEKLQRPATGIGVGVAELVDLSGNVTSGQTIAWRNLPVRQAFAKLAPTTVESDVRAAALAEALFGAGREFRLFVYVTIGTGISCCLVQDGRPHAGARGNALLFASSPWSMTCPNCGRRLEPVLEDLASGPGLVAGYNELGSPKLSRAEEVLAAAAAGDPTAQEVVQAAGAMLGSGLGFLINVLDPQAVIVGGGLGLAGGLYWTSLVQSTRDHIWADTTRDLPILPAALGNDAGLIGAAAAIERTHDL